MLERLKFRETSKISHQTTSGFDDEVHFYFIGKSIQQLTACYSYA